ncbi:MAG TPA: ATP-binding protein [Mycobacteriales bacterium]|nr:ATP-binding protein [Mycobacteriales bacterium]
MCCGRLLADLQLDGLSAADPSVHIDLAPTPLAARTARAFLADHLDGLPAESADAATLCASELVTNGVLHARTPLVFGVTTGRDWLLVTVADRAEGEPCPPPPDNERPSGRGLVLVDALATHWGVQEKDDGKTVWFTVPRGAA